MASKQVKDIFGGNKALTTAAGATVNAAKDTTTKAANTTATKAANTTYYTYGSTGSGVKELQKKLIAAGYDVGDSGADGVYGNKTAAAVKKYQKDHGLTVDGIAGKNTLGSISSGISSNAAKALNTVESGIVNAGTDFTYDDFTYQDFAASDFVNQARGLLNQHQANKPGDYSPVWQDEADAYLNQYQNRDPFSYDFNSDALYLQLKDQYANGGNMAMMDTMGQAAALNGGYGSSYAQAAGQQAYNQYLTQLTNVMPELYQMAHDRYTQDGQNMLDMYDLYMNREAMEYGKYQDVLGNWYQEDARLQSNYDNLYNREWNEYLEGKETARQDYLTGREEAYNDYWNNINMEYQKDRDKVADEQWEKSFKKSSSSSGSGNSKPAYDEKTAKIQQELLDAGYDIKVDGIWGPKTQKAYDDYQKNTPDETGLTPARQDEIENWIMTAISNAKTSSFDPKKLIRGTSYLTSEEERNYAYSALEALYF